MKLLIAVMVSVVIFSIGLVLRFALLPKAIPIIDLSHYESQEQVGRLISRSLKPELEKITTIILDIPQKAVVDGLAESLSDFTIAKDAEEAQVQLQRGKKSILIGKNKNTDQSITIFEAAVEQPKDQCELRFDPEHPDFLKCAPLSLLGPKYRKTYKSSGQWMALSQFGKRAYVLFLQ